MENEQLTMHPGSPLPESVSLGATFNVDPSFPPTSSGNWWLQPPKTGGTIIGPQVSLGLLIPVIVVVAIAAFAGSFLVVRRRRLRAKSAADTMKITTRQPTAPPQRPPEPAVPYQPAPTRPQPARDRIFCYSCGAENPTGAIYCKSCGTKIG